MGFFVIAFFILSVFLRIYTFPFLTFDDAIHIYENELLAKSSFLQMFNLFKEPFQGLYIPVTYIFWWIEARLSLLLIPSKMPSSSIFHIVSLILHILNSFFVYSILKNFYRLMPSLIGALIFAIHPLQVETVAWISAQKDLVSNFFALSSLCLILKINPKFEKSSKELMKYFLASLLFILALLSKPSAISLPILGFILLYGKVEKKSIFLMLLPWIFLTIPFLILTKLSQPDFIIGKYIPPLYRPLVAIDAVIFYISKLIFPFSLTLNYGRVPELLLKKWWAPHIWLVPALFLIFIMRSKWKKVWLISLSLFIAYLLPVLGFVTFYYQNYSTVADRFCYISLIGFSYLVSHYYWVNKKYYFKFFVFFLILFFTFKSMHQLSFWKSEESLLERTAKINPNADTFYALGVDLAKNNKYDEAIKAYLNVLRYDKHHYAALNNLSLILFEKGYFSASQHFLEEALKAKPDSPELLNNIGGVFMELGKSKEAEKLFQKAIKFEPKDGAPYFNLALIYEKKKEYKKALLYYDVAISKNYRDRVAKERKIKLIAKLKALSEKN